MGKTYRNQDKDIKRKKPRLPRGEYRARWEMVHEDKTNYNRKDYKQAVDWIEEIEEEI